MEKGGEGWKGGDTWNGGGIGMEGETGTDGGAGGRCFPRTEALAFSLLGSIRPSHILLIKNPKQILKYKNIKIYNNNNNK